jgi:hypothetical protein
VHIAQDGEMTVYPIGIRHVRSGRWRLQPDAPTDAPWFAKPEHVTPELIEQPFVLR